MQRSSEEIREMLRKLKYQQQAERQILNILESYESLANKLEDYLNSGAESIGLWPEHYADKPFMKLVGKEIMLYVNN